LTPLSHSNLDLIKKYSGRYYIHTIDKGKGGQEGKLEKYPRSYTYTGIQKKILPFLEIT